jgi:REP element-mobilizing transposase RayT
MNDCPDNNVINGWRNHNTKGLAQGATPTKLSDIIGAFKSMTTNQYIKNVKTNNWQAFEKRLWQRNYYEHIVRDKKSYLTISQYIKNNPRNW